MYSLAEIASQLGAELRGDPDRIIKKIAALEDAGDGDVAFLTQDKYKKQLETTNASVVLLQAEHVSLCPVDCLVVDNPALSYIDLAKMFLPRSDDAPTVHPTAVIGRDSIIDPSATIGPYCVIGDRVRIGANTELHPHCVIENDCSVADDCIFHANTTLYRGIKCGSRVIIHASAVVGSDGFGNVKSDDGWHKIPHLGSVVLEDDVEIGAGTTIDRGVVANTLIGKGVKLDNLIHIAHNVHIGSHTVMAASSAVAGSTKIGANCMFGGMVGIADNLTIVDNTVVFAKTAVTKSISEPGVYASVMQAQPIRRWRRLHAHFTRLMDLHKKVRNLGEKSYE